VYHCLVSFLGEDGGSGRKLKEVLIRSLGIHVISLASYGHLMSMQGVASAPSWEAFIRLLVFFFVPELPAVQLASRVFRSSIQCLRRRPYSLSYWLATCLGTRCQASTSSGNAVPLHKLDPTHAHYKRKTYGVTWVGRLILLILLLVQYSSVAGIRYRALTLFADRWNDYIVLDLRNFQMVLGGMAAVINSALLTLLNLTWHHAPASSDVEFAQLSSTTEQITSKHQPRHPPAAETSATLPSINSIPQRFQR